MKLALAAVVALVVLVHQDFWFWTDKTLLFGFLPVGFVYHLGYSILAAATMWLLVKFAWPARLDDDGRPPP